LVESRVEQRVRINSAREGKEGGLATLLPALGEQQIAFVESLAKSWLEDGTERQQGNE
jgi:hypothetical protein